MIECQYDCKRSCLFEVGRRRRIKLQNSKEGIFSAFFSDSEYIHFGRYAKIGGLEAGIFSTSKGMIICRDVLDILVYNDACRDHTLWKSYESDRRMVVTVETSSANVRSDGMYTRSVSSVFGLYLKKLHFVGRTSLRSMFNCSIYCDEDKNGANRMNVVFLMELPLEFWVRFRNLVVNTWKYQKQKYPKSTRM